MAGMMNTPSPRLLQSSAATIESRVPKEMKENFNSLITAGSHLLWDDKTHKYAVSYLRQIKSAADIPKIVSVGIVNVIRIVLKESGMPITKLAPVSFAAAHVLMLHVLEYIQKMMKIPINEKVLDATTMETTKELFKLYGITKEKMQAYMDKYTKGKGETGGETATAEEMVGGGNEVAIPPGASVPGSPPPQPVAPGAAPVQGGVA